jgi:hypothetical protein
MTKPRRTALDEAKVWEAAAKEIPWSWLDPLLTGPSAVIHKSPCPEVEALLNGVRKRLLDKAAAIKAGRRGGKR